MRIIIAGGRDFIPFTCHRQWLNQLLLHQQAKHDPIVEVVSGCANGADLFGEQWAYDCSIPVKKFRANWSLHGRKAGPIRNAQMGDYLEQTFCTTGETVAVVLFPGGKGTADMYEQAKRRELTVYDWRERTPD